MQQEELPVVFGKKKKLFQVVVWEGYVQSRINWGTPALIKLSHRGACHFPWCLLLVGLLMTVIAGKSITANTAVGKQRETAPNAVPKTAPRFKTTGQEGWAQWWNTGVGPGRPESLSQLYHRFPVRACLPAATDFLFCHPGQITPAHLARVIHWGLEDTLRCLIKRKYWSLDPDSGWLFLAAKVKIKTQRRSYWSQINNFFLVDQKKWKKNIFCLNKYFMLGLWP